MTSFMYKPEPLLAIFAHISTWGQISENEIFLQDENTYKGGSKFSNTQNKNEYCNVNGKTDL